MARRLRIQWPGALCHVTHRGNERQAVFRDDSDRRRLLCLVEKGSHLLEPARYIHLNPVRAGLVSRPEEHGWSSYGQYATGRGLWKWLETAWTLEQLGGVGRDARARDREFMEGGVAREASDPLAKGVCGFILGSERFLRCMREKFLSDREDGPARSVKRRLANVSVGRVMDAVIAGTGASEGVIWARGRHGNEARELVMYLARKHTGETNVALGREFGGIAGTNVSYVSRKVRDGILVDRAFQGLCERIEKTLFSEG